MPVFYGEARGCQTKKAKYLCFIEKSLTASQYLLTRCYNSVFYSAGCYECHVGMLQGALLGRSSGSGNRV